MPGFDIDGAAQDVADRAKRWSRFIAKFPALMTCYQLLTRNPWAAAETAKAIQKILAKHPDKARTPDEPLDWTAA